LKTSAAVKIDKIKIKKKRRKKDKKSRKQGVLTEILKMERLVMEIVKIL